MQQNYPQGLQATFVSVPLGTNSSQIEKERIEKLLPKKTIKDLSTAQLIFGGIAAVTQVILFSSSSPVILNRVILILDINKPPLGYTNCRWMWGVVLRWNWPLDRTVFRHCRRSRTNGIPGTILFHCNSIHGLEHHCVSFCLTIDRFFWNWNGSDRLSPCKLQVCVWNSIADGYGSRHCCHHNCSLLLPSDLYFST